MAGLSMDKDAALRGDRKTRINFDQYPYLEFRLRADLTEAEEGKVSSQWIEEGGLMVGSEWESLEGWLKMQVDTGRGNQYSLRIYEGQLQWAEPTMVVVYGQEKGRSDLIVGVAGPDAGCLNGKDGKVVVE